MLFPPVPLVLLTVGLLSLQPVAARAQAAPAVPVQENLPHTLASVTPSDGNYKAHNNWNKGCEERVAAMKGKPCDVIFIGDSITQNFVEAVTPRWPLVGKPVWDKYYGSRNALDFGVGADATQHVLWRLDHMDIQGFKPKVAVVLIGTNNTNDSVPDIAAGVKAVLNKTASVFPGVKIILVSILPNARQGQKMADVNKLIQGYADDKAIYYFDLASKMTPTGNNAWKGIGFDRIHVTTEGYELWASSMDPLLTQLLASSAGAK